MSTNQKGCGRCETNPCTCAWLEGERRMENIGPNGPTAEHYDSPTFDESANFEPGGPVAFHPAPSEPIHSRPAGYDSLYLVLREAFDQASKGKGSERHAQGQPFDEQPMQKLIELYGLGFALGQAGKKMQESQRMDKDAAKRELLGAINYIAGAIIHLEKAQ